MNRILNKIPINNFDLRRDIYNGKLFLNDATNDSMEFVERSVSIIKEVFSVDDFRHSHEHLTEEHFIECHKKAQDKIKSDSLINDLIVKILNSFNFDINNTVYQQFMLRAVPPNPHSIKRYKNVLHPHRDTWYGYPLSLIIMWIPLSDLVHDETMAIYDEYFNKPCNNNSVICTSDWQNKFNKPFKLSELKLSKEEMEKRYLFMLDEDTLNKENAVKLSCKKGQILFMSGAHLHQTLNHQAPKTRFSIEGRILQLEDCNSTVGAPNIDDKSEKLFYNKFGKFIPCGSM